MDLNLGSILLWGLFATGILTLILTGSQRLGWSRMSIPFMLGTLFTPRRRRAFILGVGAHAVFGCLFALLYALVFESLGEANWWLGALLGCYHGLFMLVVVMTFLPEVHPRMANKHHGPTPTRQLEPPGFLALHYGRRTPLLTLLAHLLYGLILGAGYALAA